MGVRPAHFRLCDVPAMHIVASLRYYGFDGRGFAIRAHRKHAAHWFVRRSSRFGRTLCSSMRSLVAARHFPLPPHLVQYYGIGGSRAFFCLPVHLVQYYKTTVKGSSQVHHQIGNCRSAQLFLSLAAPCVVQSIIWQIAIQLT